MWRACVAIALIGCGGEPTLAWVSAPPLALGPTQETAAVAVGGKVYVLGGFNNGAIVPAVQVFDPATGAWDAGPALPAAVHHATAAAVGDTIYVLGALATPSFVAVGDTWSWTPGDAAWIVRAPMPAGSERGAAVAGELAGKLVVAGGYRARAVTDVAIYDPALDAWTAGPPLPAPRDHACGAVLDGALYVAGGRDGANAATLYELAPGAAAWVERAALPTARGGTGCGVVGDRLIVAGGEGNPDAPSGVFAEVEAYTPGADRWETLAPMPTPRHGMGAAGTGGRLYVPGGATMQGFGAVATHEILTP